MKQNKAIPSENNRVLIKTLPLTSGNYGGILQAFALQNQVRSLGYFPIVDSPTEHVTSLRSIVWRLKNCLQHKSFDVAISPAMRNDSQFETKSFINKHIETIELVNPRTGRPSKKLLATFRIFLCGSDQVWRPAYADVGTYMFNFVDDQSVRMISYAASFGKSELTEYDSEDLRIAKSQLPKFDAISVRESSGVDLAARLGVRAELVLDPTLLAGKDLFLSLLKEEKRNVEKTIVVMMLDESVNRNEIISRLKTNLGYQVSYFYPPKLISRKAFKKSPKRFKLKPVEEWLEAIRSADFVITDSYHVTLFSILFQREFLTIGNIGRGVGRFTSILELLGLQHRLIDENGVFPKTLQGINWEEVDKRLQPLRHSSMIFLSTALSGSFNEDV